MRKIITIDCQYLQPRFAAAYLLVDQSEQNSANKEAAFIDNNTAHSVPLLLKALENEGLSPDQVKYVIVTHVHLDHAGGTSRLMKACPNATLLAHPRAVPHMIDPSKLVGSAKKVYGEEAFAKLYGEIEAVPAERVKAMNDGEIAELAGKPLQFIHTRGHANHHFCIYDAATQAVFTGDAFGLCYPALQSKGLFIFPSTSPTDFIADEAKLSLDKIVATGAKVAYPTHFGAVTNIPEAARQLRSHLNFSEKLRTEARDSGVADKDLTDFCEKRLWEYFGPSLDNEGRELLKLDIELNAQGLAYAALKERAKRS